MYKRQVYYRYMVISAAPMGGRVKVIVPSFNSIVSSFIQEAAAISQLLFV